MMWPPWTTQHDHVYIKWNDLILMIFLSLPSEIFKMSDNIFVKKSKFTFQYVGQIVVGWGVGVRGVGWLVGQVWVGGWGGGGGGGGGVGGGGWRWGVGGKTRPSV